MPTLQRTDDVFILDLGDGENRFTRQWMNQVTEALDEVDGADGPRALLTVASGKIWSNGLDLDWLTSHVDKAGEYVAQVHSLFVRMLSTQVSSIAVLQGHTFAAGALLALGHDVRMMRADRGFFCLPEVDISIPFSPGMSAMVQARLTPNTAHEAMCTGRRYGGTDALEAGSRSSRGRAHAPDHSHHDVPPGHRTDVWRHGTHPSQLSRRPPDVPRLADRPAAVRRPSMCCLTTGNARDSRAPATTGRGPHHGGTQRTMGRTVGLWCPTGGPEPCRNPQTKPKPSRHSR
jgi:enoyl-CoA hydratase/carnithine racemase